MVKYSYSIYTWMMYFVTLFATICTSTEKKDLTHLNRTFTHHKCLFYFLLIHSLFCHFFHLYHSTYYVYASRLVVRFSIASMLKVCTHNYLYCLISKHSAAETCVFAVFAYTYDFIHTRCGIR